MKHPEFRGVLYDEAEHGQMRRDRNTNGGRDDRATGKVHPYFAATDGMTLEQAYNAVYSSAKAVAENYRRAGATPMTEHVFPVMFHTFARAGFDPATKFLKEGIDPVFAAIAMGAAREYGREFCVTPDLWGLSGFPGHPPEELRASLLYAYWIGAAAHLRREHPRAHRAERRERRRPVRDHRLRQGLPVVREGIRAGPSAAVCLPRHPPGGGHRPVRRLLLGPERLVVPRRALRRGEPEGHARDGRLVPDLEPADSRPDPRRRPLVPQSQLRRAAA